MHGLPDHASLQRGLLDHAKTIAETSGNTIHPRPNGYGKRVELYPERTLEHAHQEAVRPVTAARRRLPMWNAAFPHVHLNSTLAVV